MIFDDNLNSLSLVLPDISTQILNMKKVRDECLLNKPITAAIKSMNLFDQNNLNITNQIFNATKQTDFSSFSNFLNSK